MITATSAGNEPKQLGSRSAQAIAGDDGASTGAKGNGDAITAPFPAGDQ